MTWSVTTGDALDVLRTMPSESVHCCITSPPYWGLRDYGVEGMIGLEPTLEIYFGKLLAVFAEVHRVLRGNGTLWVNMGDAYVTRRNGSVGATTIMGGRQNQEQLRKASAKCGRGRISSGGLKYKDLIGQPWRLAFALQEAGWYLRRDIIWHKPSPMPESCRDRPTTAHEYIFLLSKSPRYFYDADAIAEPVTGNAHPRGSGKNPKAVAGWSNGSDPHTAIEHNRPAKEAGRKAQGLRTSERLGRGAGWRSRQNESFSGAVNQLVTQRNCRSVWKIASKPFKGAHFATFPPKLIEPCVLAGCPMGGGNPRSVQRRRHDGTRRARAWPQLCRHRTESRLRGDVAQALGRGGSYLQARTDVRMSYLGQFRFDYRGFQIIRTTSPRDKERWLVHWPVDNRDFSFHATQGSARREIDALRDKHERRLRR